MAKLGTHDVILQRHTAHIGPLRLIHFAQNVWPQFNTIGLMNESRHMTHSKLLLLPFVMLNCGFSRGNGTFTLRRWDRTRIYLVVVVIVIEDIPEMKRWSNNSSLYTKLLHNNRCYGITDQYTGSLITIGFSFSFTFTATAVTFEQMLVLVTYQTLDRRQFFHKCGRLSLSWFRRRFTYRFPFIANARLCFHVAVLFWHFFCCKVFRAQNRWMDVFWCFGTWLYSQFGCQVECCYGNH